MEIVVNTTDPSHKHKIDSVSNSNNKVKSEMKKNTI